MFVHSTVAAVSDRRRRSEIDATIYVAQYSCAQRNLQPPRRLLFRPPVGWYDVFMSRDTKALLDAFERLPVEEKRAFTQEVLRRSLPFDSGPLEDEEIGAASAALFDCL